MIAIALAALAVPLAAEAQSYRCTGKDGKKYYGATIPSQCIGVTVEQLSAQGVVVRRIEGQMTPEERAKRDAEAKAAAEKEAQDREDSRRNRALLATYQSEKDIEDARKRALDDNDKGVAEIQANIAQLKKREDVLAKEMEFYKGKNKPPAKLDEDVKNNRNSIKQQEELIAQKKKDVATINAKFDDDKRRFIELQKGGGVVPAAATPPKAATKK
jgi:hypothetical protein